MRKFFILLSVLAIMSCNNESSSDGVKTKADTLFEEVMDGHDTGMGRMGRLTKAEQITQRLIDSLDKLPAKAKEAAGPYRAKLNDLLSELSTADSSMIKWMEEFKIDSAVDNAEERIKYLLSEKGKVTTVKNAILSGIEKADSVLKDKF